MDFKPFKIGKYLLLERIATGGMAEVYRAKASGAGGFEKQLAIKRILPNYASNEEFRRMFEYEARLSSMLNHANIVQVYDFVKSDETYLLAMEYVPGKNLRQFINKAKKLGITPPLPFSAWVLNEVCKGLEYAHSKKDDLTGKPLNIIHRDMSPQNIMISYDGAVKIVDFGIAKAKDRVDETRSGVIKGKFGYMSPEQSNGQPIDHRSDIFSTGIILYEMITGKRLFSAENDMATLKLIQECVIANPTRVNPKIPVEFEKIALKALAKDLKLRYQNGATFQRHIQAFLNKYFPSFTQKEAADIIQRVFRVEIEKEKKRFEQLYRQSIPFSQGAKITSEESEIGVDAALKASDDEDQTRSEQIHDTAITSVDDRELAAEGSFEESAVTGNDPTQVSKSVGNIDETQIDSLIIEDESVPTLSKGASTGPSITSGEDNTLVNDPLLDIPDPPSTSFSRNSSTELSGITIGKPSPSISLVRPGSGKKKQLSVSGNNQNLVVRNDYKPSDSSDQGLKGLGSGPQDSISLVTRGSELTGPPLLEEPNSPTAGRFDQNSRFNSRPEYLPRRKKFRILPMLFFITVLGGTGWLYSVYYEGGMPVLIQTIRDRIPSGLLEDPPPETTLVPQPIETIEPDRAKTYGDCSIEVTTDPSGATLIINGEERGITSTTTSVVCGKGFDVTLKREGFEALRENIVIKNSGSSRKIFRTLRKIPTGELELVISRNVDIYVDGKRVEEAVADETIVLRLRGNRAYNIRFVNEVLGIDVTREFTVETDSVQRQTINLDDAIN